MNKIDWTLVSAWVLILAACVLTWVGIYRLGKLVVMAVGNAL